MKSVCKACMHHCQLSLGQSGICRARKNVDGVIVCVNYGRVTSISLDPIEKKPLRQFYPGSLILSVGSYGCNLNCSFCQNHEISMAHEQEVETMFISPQVLANQAKEYESMGNIGIAYTYNEPLVGWEFVRDTAKIVKECGMKNVLVTNGTASLQVLEEVLPYIDAMNIDLKAFRSDTYHRLGGNLEQVQNFILRAAEDCHIELTTLIVPGENDEEVEMEEEARWIASIGTKVPLHITRFFPRYLAMNKQPTQIDLLYDLAEVARNYLDDVYVGNV